MTQKEYNGWTNYETWNVKLWIDNDQGLQEYWNERTMDQDCIQGLADELKEYFEEQSQEMLKAASQQASVWSDLIGAALSEVNWHEIAEAFWTDNDRPKEGEEETETAEA